MYYIYAGVTRKPEVISTSQTFKGAIRFASILMQDNASWRLVPCDLDNGIIRRWKGNLGKGSAEVFIKKIKREL